MLNATIHLPRIAGAAAIVVARFALSRHRSRMPRLELYPFRYRSELTGKWVTARYKAEMLEITARHAEFEIIGPPEIREFDQGDQWHWFSPYRATSTAEFKRSREPQPQLHPASRQRALPYRRVADVRVGLKP